MGAPRLPTFLVLGAMKSGTTALYYYLRQHPQIYLHPTRKEAQFFCYEGCEPRFAGPGDQAVNDYIIRTIEDYRQMFAGAAGQPAVGEVGTVYIYLPGTAERIRHHVPEARLVAILRSPVERAYSSFLHLVREQLEPCRELEEAVRREPERIRANWSPHWHYVRAGFYRAQVQRYLDVFDRRQLRFYVYDDYLADPVALVQDIFRFLGVDDRFVPDMSLRHNVGGIPRSPALHRFLDAPHALKRVLRPLLSSERRLALRERVRGLNLRRPPPLRPEMRRHLINVYREDVLALGDLLGRDLSGWLDPTREAQGIE
jgi:hypothetical protein